MSDRPILMSTMMVKQLLNKNKTHTRRFITKNNSTIGEGGDWGKLCWDGSEVLNERLQECFDHGQKGSMAEAIKNNGYHAPSPWVDNSYPDYKYLHVPYEWKEHGTIFRVYPKIEPKNILWVKETHAFEERLDNCKTRDIGEAADVQTWYKAEHWADCYPLFLKRGKWRPSIFMPRWACRIQREVVSVKSQQLGNMTDEEAMDEGMDETIASFLGISMGDYSKDCGNYYLKIYKAYWNYLNGKTHPWDDKTWVWDYGFREL